VVKIGISLNETSPPLACFKSDEVLNKLNELSNSVKIEDAPTTAVVNFKGNELIIGLGIDPSFLCIQIFPCDGEFYTSIGNEKPGKEIMSYGAGQDSYWDSENLIPFANALMAIEYFIENEKLSPKVKWKKGNGEIV